MIHIKNARICDGTGAEPYPGELLVKEIGRASCMERV